MTPRIEQNIVVKNSYGDANTKTPETVEGSSATIKLNGDGADFADRVDINDKNPKVQQEEDKKDSGALAVGGLVIAGALIGLAGGPAGAVIGGLAGLLLGLTSCQKKEPIIDTPETPATPEPSPEELEFSKAARERLESDPELLQECVEYVYNNHYINDPNILTSNNVEGRLFVVMCILVSCKEVRDWFCEKTGIPGY